MTELSDPQYISYECTRQTFRPVMIYPVRWLDWEEDYLLVQEFWPSQTPNGWYHARQEGFQYCAVIEHGQIRALAAVWRYSDTTWEVASVYTQPGVRGKGYAKAVVSFVTAYILEMDKRATCNTSRDNRAMQRVAESVGFRQFGS